MEVKSASALQMQGPSQHRTMTSEILTTAETILLPYSLPLRRRCGRENEHQYVCIESKSMLEGDHGRLETPLDHALALAAPSASPTRKRHIDSCLESIDPRRSMHESVLMTGEALGGGRHIEAMPACSQGSRRSAQTSNAQTDNRSNEFLRDHYHQRAYPSMTGISMVKSLTSLGGSHDASCMEQLLVLCATAVENNDATLAQQIMWVLNNTASTEGDPNQRVAAYFLRALVSRAAPNLEPDLHAKACSSPALSAIQLADYVDLTPWHRFGFSAANGAILEALEGKRRVHIVDFSINHCMQWPTLIEALSKRPEGPPRIRLTIHGARPQVPPFLNMTLHDIGVKLWNFARSRNVPFQCRVLPRQIDQLNRGSFNLDSDEALVVNCQMRLHYIPDESVDPACPRAQFLELIRSLDPTIVTFVEEDANLIVTGLVARLRAAFNYLWIPFDAIDTILPRESQQRLQYEADVGSRIENIIACEGPQRMERLECKERWMQRIRKANLQSIPFSAAVVAEVKSMLVEHAVGWGLKQDEDAVLLTWKGHDVVFATALVSVLPTTS